MRAAPLDLQGRLLHIGELEGGTVVDEQLLRESNLIRGHFAGIKILGEGELKQGLNVQADKVSATAREKIEKAGGTVTLLDARRIEKAETDVPPSEANSDTAAATTKPRARAKTKSPTKNRE